MTGRFVAAWASYELLGPGPAGPPDEALKVDRKDLHLRCLPTWLAGKWSIILGDFPIKTIKNLNS